MEKLFSVKRKKDGEIVSTNLTQDMVNYLIHDKKLDKSQFYIFPVNTLEWNICRYNKMLMAQQSLLNTTPKHYRGHWYRICQLKRQVKRNIRRIETIIDTQWGQ